MTTSEQRVKATEKTIREAAERTHALLLVSVGTKDCPSLDRIDLGIRDCLTAAKAYPDSHLFWGPGFCVMVDRAFALIPGDIIFEVLIPATDRMVSHREDEG